jgi:hypothetical protein
MTSPPPSDDETLDGDLELQITQVAAHPEDDGNLRVLIGTSRGDIRGVLHPCANNPGAVIYVGGAMGGLTGPANDIYVTIAERLKPDLSGLRITYRRPGEFFECVLDVLAAISFVRGIGAGDAVALVGHSFGGAVVIKAAEISDSVKGVAALSSQLYGTRGVEQLRRPLLLVHGMQDRVLDHAASEDIHARAVEPKRLVLYAESDHSLAQNADELEELLAAWLTETLGRGPAVHRN